MTPEKRERRIARFEAWGIERVKADLLSGGHRLIGGTREVRELAHEWVRMKESEAKATKDEVLLLKPQFMGLGLDLKAAGRKFASQLKKWRG